MSVSRRTLAALSNQIELAGTLDLQSLGGYAPTIPSRTAAEARPRSDVYRKSCCIVSSGHAEQRQCGAENRSVVAVQGVPTRSSSAVIDSPGQILAHVAASARPCTQLARLETTLVREDVAGVVELLETMRIDACRGCERKESTPGLPERERNEQRRGLGRRHFPDCQAASSPLECAKPPVGNAESASCQHVSDVVFGDTKTLPMRDGLKTSHNSSRYSYELSRSLSHVTARASWRSQASERRDEGASEGRSPSDETRTTNTSARAGGRARAPLSGLPHPR